MWANSSIPMANPLITQIPFLEIASANLYDWLIPYLVQSLDPTTAIPVLFKSSIFPSAYIFLGKSFISNNFFGYL